MTLKADGKLGIGTSAPATLLHVAGTVQVGVDDTGHDVIFYGATSGSYMHWDESADYLSLINSDISLGVVGAGAGRILIDNTTDTVARIKVSRGGATGVLAFHTGSDTEALRITNAGRVGIGTMAPAQKLSIESSGTASSEIDISLVSGTSNKECILNFGKNLATADRYLGRIFYQVDNNAMGFWTNGGPKMLINHTGAVGIGTAVPTSKLHVYNGDIRIEGGTSGTSNKIIFKTTDNSDLSKYIGTTSYWTEIGVHNNEGLRVKNNSGTNIFQVSGGGNVGIGTTSPSTKLHV
jgi:hypothetical protein